MQVALLVTHRGMEHIDSSNCFLVPLLVAKDEVYPLMEVL